MICTWTLFAIMSAFAKYSYTHVTPLTAFFAQHFIGLLFLVPHFLKQRVRWMQGGQWGLITARGLLGGAAFFLLFYAISKVSLTDATLLNNAAPLYVPFLSALILKTRLSLPIVGSASIGFVGILFVLQPSADLFQIHALPALASGFLSAVVMILMRLLSKEDPERVIFSHFAIASLCAAPIALPQLTALPPSIWLVLFCIGALFVAGQFCYMRSFRYAEATILAPFSYSFVAISGLIDWIVWDHSPTLYDAIGVSLIMIGGICTILQAKKQVPVSSEAD